MIADNAPSDARGCPLRRRPDPVSGRRAGCPGLRQTQIGRFGRRQGDSLPVNQRSSRGQGLLEFALVIPLLLLLVMGIVEFGRVFAVYVNLFNAAREGARYGMVAASDKPGIERRARERIFLVDPDPGAPNPVNVSVWYDHYPYSTDPITDPAVVRRGDRVVVQVAYDLLTITPLIQAFAPSLTIETQAARTVTNYELSAGPEDDVTRRTAAWLRPTSHAAQSIRPLAGPRVKAPSASAVWETRTRCT